MKQTPSHPRVNPDPIEVSGQLSRDVRLPPRRQPHQRDHVGRVGRGRRLPGRALERLAALALRALGQGHGQVVAKLHHGVLPLAAVRRADAGTVNEQSSRKLTQMFT